MSAIEQLKFRYRVVDFVRKPTGTSHGKNGHHFHCPFTEEDESAAVEVVKLCQRNGWDHYILEEAIRFRKLNQDEAAFVPAEEFIPTVQTLHVEFQGMADFVAFVQAVNIDPNV